MYNINININRICQVVYYEKKTLQFKEKAKNSKKEKEKIQKRKLYLKINKS